MEMNSMPLVTEIERNGRRLKIRWGQFHVAAMAVATMFEHPEDWKDAKPNADIIEDYPATPQPLSGIDVWEIVSYPVLAEIFPDGEYTLKHPHAFLDLTDGEVFELKKGDKLSIWRETRG
jgi:hypothetical protein